MAGSHLRAVGAAILVSLVIAAPAPMVAAPQVQAPPAVVIDTEGAPALGPVNAPVTIVEFGDFQCRFCARGARALRRLQATNPDRVRWVFKHYPLSSAHPEAPLAHEAAIAAQQQGKFWEMHERLFQNRRLRSEDLLGYAQESGLDMAAFKEALDTRRYRPQVIRDQREGRRLQVFGTPTYFVNGIRIIGARTTAEFSTLVDAIIRPPEGAPREASGDPATSR